VSDAGPQPENPWWHPDELLGPGPSAVLAFVLAVLVLMGSNLMTNATLTFFGQYFTSTLDWAYVASMALAALAPALASAYLARRAITTAGATAWELVIGRAALVLAVIGFAYALLLTVGLLIHMD
jgi:hypothetical protein